MLVCHISIQLSFMHGHVPHKDGVAVWLIINSDYWIEFPPNACVSTVRIHSEITEMLQKFGRRNYSFMGSEDSLLVLQNHLHLRINLLRASSIQDFRLKPVCIRYLLSSHQSYWLWFHHHNYITIFSVHPFLILFGNRTIFISISVSKIVKIYSNFMLINRFYAQNIKYLETLKFYTINSYNNPRATTMPDVFLWPVRRWLCYRSSRHKVLGHL